MNLSEPPWHLLYRTELVDGLYQYVWLYEPLRGKALKQKINEGWKWIECT